MGFLRLSKIAFVLAVIFIILQFYFLSLYQKPKNAATIEVSQESYTATPKTPTRNVQTFRAITSKISFFSEPKGSIEKNRSRQEHSESMFTDAEIHISAVVCGGRAVEATTMLKSCTLFTNQAIQLHIVAEDHLHSTLKNIFNGWSNVKSNQVKFKLYSLSYPDGENTEEWKNLFKPCATQRLFLLDVLEDVDSILYMDTDVLVMRPVEDIWNHFSMFDSVQLASMSPESEETALSWYPRFAQHPFYGQNGMNSGVMLMNLTRMREFGWTKKVLEIHRDYKLKITWGDQDIVNILFHDYPELLYTYSCEWNYRPDHCMYGNNCATAKKNGISVIHGNRGVYHDEKQPFFKAIYTAIRDFQPSGDLNLLASHLAENLHATVNTYCGSMIVPVLKYPNEVSKRL